MLLPLLGCLPAFVPPAIEGNPAHDWDADGFSEDEGDCDDGDDGVHPDARERCDGVDDDCDPATPECPGPYEAPLDEAERLRPVGGGAPRFGTAVAGGIDVDGDGWVDLLVGAPGCASELEACLYLYHPHEDGLGLPDVLTFGDGSMDAPGEVVLLMPDVHGDGVADVVASAPTYDVSFGEEGAVFGWFDGLLDRSPALRRFGGSSPDRLGHSLAYLGDADEDGFHELLVGAPFGFHEGFNSGIVLYVVLDDPEDESVTELLGEESEDGFGVAVSPAGDVDGDGRADWLVG
ncbi:MAG: MopE-related protein, partial [Myxococcota bacterium]